MTLSDTNVTSGGQTKVVKKWHQLGASLCASLTGFTSGSSFLLSAILIPQLEEPESSIQATIEDGSWIASILQMGGILGSLVGSQLSERIGRRKSLMVDNLIHLVGLLLVALAPNMTSILIGRFLNGYGQSSSRITAPIYISEISQPGIRNLTSSLFLLCLNCGMGFVMVLGAAIPWRFAAGFACIPSLIALVGLQFMCPETPVWLVRKGQDEEVFKSMNFLRGDPEIMRKELESLKAMHTTNNNKGKKLSFVMLLSAKLAGWKKMLTRPAFIKAFLIILIIVNLGLGFSGMNVIMVYLIKVLKESELPMDPYWAGAGLCIYQSILSVFSAGIVRKSRRRPVFFASGTIIASSTFILALYSLLKDQTDLLDEQPWTKWIPLLAIAMFFTGMSGGYMTTAFGYQGELLPADTRSFGCGILGLLQNFTSFGVTKSFPSLVTSIGLYSLFWFFSAAVSTILAVMYFVLPETYGLTLEEIECMLGGKKKK